SATHHSAARAARWRWSGSLDAHHSAAVPWSGVPFRAPKSVTDAHMTWWHASTSSGVARRIAGSLCIVMFATSCSIDPVGNPRLLPARPGDGPFLERVQSAQAEQRANQPRDVEVAEWVGVAELRPGPGHRPEEQDRPESHRLDGHPPSAPPA